MMTDSREDRDSWAFNEHRIAGAAMSGATRCQILDVRCQTIDVTDEWTLIAPKSSTLGEKKSRRFWQVD
jgi:hypothetical protein